MSANALGGMHASCAVTGATGALTGKSVGIAGVINGAAGINTVTLARPIDITDAFVDGSLSDGLDGEIVLDHQNDTTIVVQTFSDAGVGEDHDFHLLVMRRGIG